VSARSFMPLAASYGAPVRRDTGSAGSAASARPAPVHEPVKPFRFH
jgi:hypothetical protein